MSDTNDDGFRHDLALLHAEADTAAAQALADALRRRGVRLAWLPPAAPTEDALVRALDDSRWVAVLWSAASRADLELRVQARVALSRRALLPVRLDVGEAPEGFAQVPEVSLSGWQGDVSEPVFTGLVQSLTLLLGVQPGAPVAAGPPMPARSPAARGGLLGRLGRWLSPPAPPAPPLPDAVWRGPALPDADLYERTIPVGPVPVPARGLPRMAGAEPPESEVLPAPGPVAPVDECPPVDRDADTSAVPLDSVATPVWLGAAAPREVVPAQRFVARLAVYAEAARGAAEAKLTALGDEGDRLVMDLAPDGDARWRVGAPVTVRLSGGAHLQIQPAEHTFHWNGKDHLAAFSVSVAADAPLGALTLDFQVQLAGIPMAFVPLPLKLVLAAGQAPEPPVLAPAQSVPRSAFASYSSLDAAQVTARLSTLQRWAPDLSIFQDCLDLTPNEEFKPQLAEQIAQRDVFLLFWSRRAASSPWVQWELKTACEARGRESVLPMPLEDPAIAQPPPEFATAHWRDRFMMAGYAHQALRDELGRP